MTRRYRHHVHNKQSDIVFIYVLAICAVIIFSFSPALFTHKKKVETVSTPYFEEKKILFNTAVFEGLPIEGKAYVVYDVKDGTVIASQNESMMLPFASITKVMTALTVRLIARDGENITITPSTIESGYDLGLRNKQVWSVDELLKYMLVFSSNDAAQAVATHFGGVDTFVSLMNTTAEHLGVHAVFTDPAGRDENGNIGGKGTVLDAAKLFSIAIRDIPDILDATTKKRVTVVSSTGKVTGVPNTNQDIETMFGVEGSKTGFTNIAGGNLGVVVDVTLGHPVVIVVLGSSKEGRFKDVQTLYKALKKSAE
ncbi:MAG: hypothetical protein RLZZ308_433 [Candidatus Parcubacteria bacterium]|jgi:serine-type D-Ala-D-Ala carboxypeptidase (penicillin-binding protein 5/6)